MPSRNKITFKDISRWILAGIVTYFLISFINPFPQIQHSIHDFEQMAGLLKTPKIDISKLEYKPTSFEGCLDMDINRFFTYGITIKNTNQYRTLYNVTIKLDFGIGEILNIKEDRQQKLIGRISTDKIILRKIENHSLIEIKKDAVESLNNCENWINFSGPNKADITFQVLPPLSSYNLYIIVNYNFLPLTRQISFTNEYSWNRGEDDIVPATFDGFIPESYSESIAYNEERDYYYIYAILLITLGIVLEKMGLTKAFSKLLRRIKFLSLAFFEYLSRIRKTPQMTLKRQKCQICGHVWIMESENTIRQDCPICKSRDLIILGE